MYTAAIVGAGFIAAKRHLPAWFRLRRDVRIAAVCDLDRARAEAMSRDFAFRRPMPTFGGCWRRNAPTSLTYVRRQALMPT